MNGDRWEEAVDAALEDVVAPALRATAVAAVLAALRPLGEDEWVAGFRAGWQERTAAAAPEESNADAGDAERGVAPVVPLRDAIPSAREMTLRATDPSAPRSLFAAHVPARRRGRSADGTNP